ncbi:MAG TPA: uroporphyrinogen decarboxylase family protein, partial [Candidatus Methylomirabilis sp.]|nr:uroporphyrinogen decarboxylase family protein [Candidatus Methylomirabilis sp.]
MTAEMTSRERVMTALNHQEPDRVPIALGQATGDGITMPAYRALLRHLGMDESRARLKDTRGQTAYPDEAVLRRFRVDMRGIALGAPDGRKEKWLDDRTVEDEWGVVRTRPADSYYFDLCRSPMPEPSLAAIERHPWPDPEDPGRYRGLKEEARRLREETEYAIVLDVNCAFFLRCCELRGWENFYTDLVGEVEFAEALMDKYLGIRLRMAERALQEVGDNVDIVMVTSDDLGMTQGTLISPTLYRALIKPRQQRTFDFFKGRTAAKRYYHNDGAIYPLLPDFVEIGVEVLNPVEVRAVGMGDTAKLKREFGDRLAFWGAIDTHHVLPEGTPER